VNSLFRELVDLLHSKNKKVFLVSGGFSNIILPVAAELEIPSEHVYANRLLFNDDGSYAGFDTNEPTSQSGGKPRVVQHVKDKYALKTIVFVGDGVTDLEASPPADAFIGYGGNVIREKVRNTAPWYITDFKQLISILSDDMRC
jgi:phosphoserine phosphatase